MQELQQESASRRGPTIFIVDDDQGVRGSLATLVESVGLNAATYRSAQEFIDDFDPDCSGVLVLDVRLRGMSGFALLEWLRDQSLHPPAIMITAYADFDTAVRAFKGGAVDILEKPTSQQLLLETIYRALERDGDARRHEAKRAAIRAKQELLSPREKEVLRFILHGRTSKQIAAEMGLSVRTVENYRTRILKRMEVGSVTKLIPMVLPLVESR
jgi:two-component system response regulator FixJ